MGQPFITKGDKTDHGGTVISCAPTSDVNHKGMARVGDMVACPRCKGVFSIAQGDNSMIVDEAAVAYHGCKTTCGAMLIAGQATATVDSVEGGSAKAGAGGAPELARGLGAIGGGIAAGYRDEPVDDRSQRFRGRFQLQDIETGSPIADRAVRVRSTGGQYLTGATDEEGYTQWVEREAAEMLAFDLIEPQP